MKLRFGGFAELQIHESVDEIQFIRVSRGSKSLKLLKKCFSRGFAELQILKKADEIEVERCQIATEHLL